MDDHVRLVSRVGEEQSDILCTLQLVGSDAQLQDRLFDQLVDLLVEGMFLDVRAEYLAGDLDREGYVTAVRELADRCKASGLLPLPSRQL